MQDAGLVLDRLTGNLEDLLRRFPDMKREALEAAGKTMLEEVRKNIRGSGMRNAGGAIPGWQTYSVGSGKGYVAVRAARGSSGKNGPGAITNYTERGHKIRGAGKSKRRVRVSGVRGYHFYANADGVAQRAALEAAQGLCEQVAKKLMEGIS